MRFLPPTLHHMRHESTTPPTGYGPQALWTMPFFVFILLNFFIFLGFDLLLPTLSLYLDGNGSTEAEIGRIYGIFTVAAIAMRTLAPRLAAGPLSTKALIRLGLFACALASAGYFWGTNTELAMVCRFVHGAGFGLTSTLIMAKASQVIPPHRMGEGMGYLGLGTTVALALGPLFGIWLMNGLGFLVLFLVVACCYIAGAGVLSALPRRVADTSDAAAQRPKPVLFSKLVVAPCILTFILGTVLSSAVIYMALFCKERGLPYAGHFFVLASVGIFVSRLYVGRINDRLGHRYVIIPSGLLLIITMLLLYQAHSMGILFTASLLYGFAVGAAFPCVQALALLTVPVERRTEAAAAFLNAYDLGFGVGSMMLGLVAGMAGGYGSVYLTAAAMAVIFLILYSICYRPFRKEAKQP